MAPLIDEATLEAKISPLIADYANALDTIKQAMTAVSDIAQELEEVKGMNSELSKQLDGSFTGLVDVAENFRSQRDALSHVKNSYGVAVREQQQARRAAAAAAAGGDNEEEGDGGPGVSVVDMFKRDFKTRMGVWENGGADKYNRDADFLSYKQKVWEVNHPGQPFRMAAAGGKPSNNNMDLDEPEEEGNEEEENEEEVDEEEEDLVMIDQQLNFQCPLTKQIMREPYTSKVCGHSFSSDIVEHLKRQFGQVECPVTGCKSYVRMSDLYKDKKLARKITRELATQEEQTRNEHEDAAVVSDEED